MTKTASRKRHYGNSFVPLIHTESSREKSTSSCSKCSAKVWKPGAAGGALIFTAIVSTACCGRAAEQIVNYVGETVATLGTVPSQEKVIAERFFDEAGGMQLILHSPWGGRINRAWGLALRKRFCVSFDRELQAAATDDGICISLVEQHSFPLSDVFSMLKPAILEYNLTQAALVSPMFTNRWRWNATRALAVRRHSGGRKIPV